MMRKLFWIVLAISVLVFPQNLTSATVKYNTALRLEQAGKTTTALQIYQELSNKYPAEIRYVQSITRIMATNEQFSAAKIYLRSTMQKKIHPEKDLLHLELANIFLKEESPDSAEQIWRHILKNSLEKKILKKMLGQMFNYGFSEDGNVALETVRKKMNDESFYATEHASYLKTRMAYQQSAYEYLRTLLGDRKQDKYIASAISKFPKDAETTGQVSAGIQKFLGDYPAFKDRANAILADFYYQRKNFEFAIQTLKQTKNPDEKLEKLGVEMLNDGNISPAISIFTELLENAADSQKQTQFQLYLGKCFYAESIILPLFANSPIQADVMFPLFQMPPKYDSEKAEKAIEYFQKLLDRERGNYQNQVKYHLAHLQLYHERNPSAATKTLQSMQNIHHKDRMKIKALLLDATILMGNAKETTFLLKQAQNLQPSHPNYSDFRLLLIRLLLFENEITAAVDSMKSIRVHLEFDHPFYNDIFQTERFFSNALKSSKTADSLALRHYLRGEQMIQNADFLGALVHWDATARDFPESEFLEHIYFRSGLVASELSYFERAKKSLNQILEQFPNSKYLDQAIFRLAEIAERENENPEVFYEQILMDFPFSTLTESARLKLRNFEGD